MTYTQQGGRVTLEMTRDQFANLILALGMAAGSQMRAGNRAAFWDLIRLANELNNGNPNFTPYEIPAEFAGVGDHHS